MGWRRGRRDEVACLTLWKRCLLSNPLMPRRLPLQRAAGLPWLVATSRGLYRQENPPGQDSLAAAFRGSLPSLRAFNLTTTTFKACGMRTGWKHLFGCQVKMRACSSWTVHVHDFGRDVRTLNPSVASRPLLLSHVNPPFSRLITGCIMDGPWDCNQHLLDLQGNKARRRLYSHVHPAVTAPQP